MSAVIAAIKAFAPSAVAARETEIALLRAQVQQQATTIARQRQQMAADRLAVIRAVQRIPR